MKRVVLALCVVIGCAHPLQANLHLSTSSGGQSVTLKWPGAPVRWFAADRGVPGVAASDFQATMARAFATWEAVPTAAISFQFAGFTGSEPFEDDGATVVGFQDQPEMERVLGATGFLIDTLTGEILEADIFFNSAFDWSTAQAGDPARFDLESVAVHEVGHLLGLGHSALGESEPRSDGGRRVLGSGAVMFPISFGRGVTHDRVLQPDDIAGVSDLYPAGSFRAQTGAVRGRVTRDGVGVRGAHVVAYSPETGRVVSGFTLNGQGEFDIAGLVPGPHIVRVEPIDDADVESFFSARTIDLDFRVTYHDRLFVAPRGGAGERLTVPVRPK